MLLLGSASFFRTFAGMIRNKVVARPLGTVGIGVLGVSTRFISLLWTVGTLSIGTALIKYLSQYLGEEDDAHVSSLLSTAFWVLVASAGLFTTGVLSFAGPLSRWLFSDEQYRPLVVTVGLGVPAIVVSRFFECVLNGQKRIGALALSTNIVTALLIVSIYPLVALLGMQGAVVSVILIYALGLGCFSYFYAKDPISRRAHPFDPRNVRLSALKTLFAFGAFDLVKGSVVYVSLLLVPVIIVHKLGIEDSGIFQSAWTISFYPTMMFNSFMQYYLPRISELESERVPGEMNQAIGLAVISMAPLILGTVVFRDLLLPLFYDSRFAAAGDVLRLLMVGKLFELVNIVFLNSLLGRAHLRSMLGFEALRSALLLLGTWLMVLRWSLAGAAVAYVVSHAVMAALGTVYLRGRLHLSVSRDNVKLVAGATLLVALLATISCTAWYHYALAIALSALGTKLLIGWDRYKAVSALYLGNKQGPDT